jgi:hypothetical protein
MVVLPTLSSGILFTARSRLNRLARSGAIGVIGLSMAPGILISWKCAVGYCAHVRVDPEHTADEVVRGLYNILKIDLVNFDRRFALQMGEASAADLDQVLCT